MCALFEGDRDTDVVSFQCLGVIGEVISLPRWTGVCFASADQRKTNPVGTLAEVSFLEEKKED